jgi:hypothetical protein
MTPKEKAEELLDKFKEINEDYIDNYQSIPCALIAVDEIIKDKKAFNQISIEYWEDVKQEIEKL